LPNEEENSLLPGVFFRFAGGFLFCFKADNPRLWRRKVPGAERREAVLFH
jgi:hypothetical protein